MAFKNGLVRSLGTSYPQQLCEGALGEALEQGALRPAQLAAASEIHAAAAPASIDRLALRRLRAERGRAEVLPELRDLAGLWSAVEPVERRRIAEVHALGAARSSPRPPSTPSHSA